MVAGWALAAAASSWVIPPGREAEILSLLESDSTSPLTQVDVDLDRIHARFEDGSVLTLVHVTASGFGCVGEGNVHVCADGGAQDSAARWAEELGPRLVALEAVWTEAVQPTQSGPDVVYQPDSAAGRDQPRGFTGWLWVTVGALALTAAGVGAVRRSPAGAKK